MALRKRKQNRAAAYVGDLLRGSTESLLLALIGNSPMYGYSIMKEIERRTDGGLHFKEGTLYPALHRLEQDGLIEGEWVSVNGMERRYYSLTEMGVEVLERRREQWRQFSTAVNRIIGPEAS
ncbi:MAG: helix-turn-helix transcriptional regulator [Chloroflexi bacterium]|nr:helix-turn-helix transcriptional regulator [Chloroflexota bacterium]